MATVTSRKSQEIIKFFSCESRVLLCFSLRDKPMTQQEIGSQVNRERTRIGRMLKHGRFLKIFETSGPSKRKEIHSLTEEGRAMFDSFISLGNL